MRTIYSASSGTKVKFTTAKHGAFELDDPQRVITTRHLGVPTGTFSLEFKNTSTIDGKPLNEVISLRDKIEIFFRDIKGQYMRDMVGVVADFPKFQQLLRGGAPDTTFRINGKTLTQGLVDYQIFYHNWLPTKSNIGGARALSEGIQFKGSPDEIILDLVNSFVDKGQYAYELPGGVKLLNELVVAESTSTTAPQQGVTFSPVGGIQHQKDLYTARTSILKQQGSLWSFLKMYSDPPWHELFSDMDVTNDIPTLYFRRTPFDFDDWKKLPIFTFEENELRDNFEVRVSDGNIRNFFFVHSALDVASSRNPNTTMYGLTKGEVPIYYNESIKRFGLRKMEVPTYYIQERKQEEEKTQSKLDLNVNWRRTAVKTIELFRWYGYNHEMAEGTIILRPRIGRGRGNPTNGLQIGCKLRRLKDGMEFYIQGVTQEYRKTRQGPSHTTTANLVRGHYPDKYKKWWLEVSNNNARFTHILINMLNPTEVKKKINGDEVTSVGFA